MSGAVLVPPGGGEIVGDTSDRRVEILSDDDALNATWSRFGPHRDGADLHVHRQHHDLFYVLDAELTLRLGIEDEPVVLAAGTLARMPPLVVHGFRNGGGGTVRYLNLHAPGRRFADYLRAMRDGRDFSYDQHPPPEDGGRPTSEAVVGGGEVVAEGNDLRVSLLADVDELAIVEVSTAGGAAPPPHVHHRHVESFYVLEGELLFGVDGSELRAGAGAWLQVPPGVAHTFEVAGGGTARFLNLHTPSAGFGPFVRALHRAENEDERAAARAAFDQAPAA